jgi:hypothetical protein
LSSVHIHPGLLIPTLNTFAETIFVKSTCQVPLDDSIFELLKVGETDLGNIGLSTAIRFQETNKGRCFTSITIGGRDTHISIRTKPTYKVSTNSRAEYQHRSAQFAHHEVSRHSLSIEVIRGSGLFVCGMQGQCAIRGIQLQGDQEGEEAAKEPGGDVG